MDKAADYDDLWKKLTPREKELLNLVLGGERGVDISKHMGVKVGTWKASLGKIFDKCGVSSRPELMAKFTRKWLDIELKRLTIDHRTKIKELEQQVLFSHRQFMQLTEGTNENATRLNTPGRSLPARADRSAS